MGLLDIFNTGDPQKDAAISRGLLQAGLQLMQSKGKFLPALSQGGMAGLGGYEHEVNRQLAAKRIGLQDQYLSNQVDQQKREAALANLPGQFIKPEMRGVDATGGMETAVENNTVPASMDLQGLVRAYMAAPGGIEKGFALQQALAPKKPEYKTVGKSLVRIGNDDRVDPVFTDPAELADKTPSAVREYEYARGQGYKGSFDQWDKDRRRAGASSNNVSVNTGQRGFDNTLKLRGDFRSEPVYKAHQEMQSAYAQIQQSLKQASPAGDLAGATKVMKLLDPGSVVRESELGMAMAATGLLDKVTNYADQIIKGVKLNPAQRKDFQNLADKLYAESVKQYNAKRLEYKGIVDRNELNEADVIGAPARTVKRSGTFNGRKVVEYSDGSIEYQD
jgi:hypothetical protein